MDGRKDVYLCVCVCVHKAPNICLTILDMKHMSFKDNVMTELSFYSCDQHLKHSLPDFSSKACSYKQEEKETAGVQQILDCCERMRPSKRRSRVSWMETQGARLMHHDVLRNPRAGKLPEGQRQEVNSQEPGLSDSLSLFHVTVPSL